MTTIISDYTIVYMNTMNDIVLFCQIYKQNTRNRFNSGFWSVFKFGRRQKLVIILSVYNYFMKKIFLLIITFFCIFGISFAQHDSWWDRGSDPLTIFESIVDDANDDQYKIQETALDGISDQQWSYAKEFKITNTLDYVRKNLDPYLQRIVYAGMVLATIALIYIWFMLVTNSVHKQWERSKLKSSFMYVLVGVFLLSWFYFIIKLIVALIASIFWWTNWDTWF